MFQKLPHQFGADFFCRVPVTGLDFFREQLRVAELLFIARAEIIDMNHKIGA